MFWSSVPLLPLGTILLLLPATHLQGDDGWRGENIYSQCNWVVPAFSPLATSHTKHTQMCISLCQRHGWMEQQQLGSCCCITIYTPAQQTSHILLAFFCRGWQHTVHLTTDWLTAQCWLIDCCRSKTEFRDKVDRMGRCKCTGWGRACFIDWGTSTQGFKGFLLSNAQINWIVADKAGG